MFLVLKLFARLRFRAGRLKFSNNQSFFLIFPQLIIYLRTLEAKRFLSRYSWFHFPCVPKLWAMFRKLLANRLQNGVNRSKNVQKITVSRYEIVYVFPSPSAWSEALGRWLEQSLLMGVVSLQRVWIFCCRLDLFCVVNDVLFAAEHRHNSTLRKDQKETIEFLPRWLISHFCCSYPTNRPSPCSVDVGNPFVASLHCTLAISSLKPHYWNPDICWYWYIDHSTLIRSYNGRTYKKVTYVSWKTLCKG